MWFSHSGKLGALLCPKTIEISADPYCFIFSMILSALWCLNKCRKLKLIAVFVLSNDSNCCSAAENKHLPLIKHPSGHKESVCFLQPPFHPPFIYWQCAIFATGKKRSTNKTGNEGKAWQRKFLKRSPLSSLEFFFTPHFCLTEGHNKLQGSVLLKQNRAVPVGLWNNRSDPIHSTLSLGFILALNAQMLWPFFGRNDCGHLFHIFPFWAIFTS